MTSLISLYTGYCSTGNAVIRSFAAPYGTSVTVSSGRLLVTGLIGTGPGESSTSVHCGSRRAFIEISTGALAASNGCVAIGFSDTRAEPATRAYFPAVVRHTSQSAP